jgi:nucleoside-diphosphate-sugar epimerase
VKRILIGGCGDLGERVGSVLADAGSQVIGVRRTRPGSSSIDWRIADLDLLEEPPAWPGADGIYYLAPPPVEGLEDPRLRRFLAGIESLPRRFVLVSTTGVYGDRKGAWVTEESDAGPSTERARRRLHAERLAASWCGEHGVELVILRVAGIVGPGRWPLDRLREGMVVLESSIAPYSNRVHIEDLVRFAVELMRRPGIRGIYNISDGRPSSLTDYFVEVAAAFGLPRPREVGLDEARKVLSPAMLSYLSESRRVSNRKLLEETGLELRYPDLRSALVSTHLRDTTAAKSRQSKDLGDS